MAKRCKKTGKVIFSTELDAKIALSRRVWKDKGEVRYYRCRYVDEEHYHLSSLHENKGHELIDS